MSLNEAVRMARKIKTLYAEPHVRWREVGEHENRR